MWIVQGSAGALISSPHVLLLGPQSLPLEEVSASVIVRCGVGMAETP